MSSAVCFAQQDVSSLQECTSSLIGLFCWPSSFVLKLKTLNELALHYKNDLCWASDSNICFDSGQAQVGRQSSFERYKCRSDYVRIISL